MVLLAGLLDVLLRGTGSAALAIAVGGVGYVLFAVRPTRAADPFLRLATGRSLHLIAAGAIGLAISDALVLLVVHPWALADPPGQWPLGEFLSTGFGLAGLARVALALGLFIATRAIRLRPDSDRRWGLAALCCALLLANSAWLAHATARLQGRSVLMLVTVLHVSGAVLWAGGIVHVVALTLLWRRHPEAGLLVARLLARFSILAIGSMALALGPGLYLSWRYVGSWPALAGTGYGIMVLTKAALLGAALILGLLNFRLLRRPVADPRGLAARLPALAEAEAGLALTMLLAAASLTSLPPAVDVVADRATPAEVLARFVPSLPRWSSPTVRDLLAAAAPIDDLLATRQPEEYAWSEYNHHTAGFFVVAMGLLAVLAHAARLRWARHWPLLFLGLAAFLFVRNDPRAWPLGPAGFWVSMVLPDVLQHRVMVAVVVTLGVFEWLVRTERVAGSGWPLAFPLLCAAGGAVLLTHSHAMWSLRSEFLAEVSHAPIGVLAVLLGWGRWLELRLPAGDRRWPSAVWPTALVLIGGVLLVYRET